MKKIAINGFGRIGRLVCRIIMDDPEFDLVAINDLSTPEQLAYLLKYDSSHKIYNKNISSDENTITINDKKINIYNCKDVSMLPWKELDVDLVFECTGLFTSYDKSLEHINSGAKKVVISAPAKGDLKTIVYNANDDILTGEEQIISAASCTTNCLAPVLKIINDANKIKKGYMTTVHAYTNDQSTLDVSHKKGHFSRRGRAAAENIVPSSTGAASAIGKVLPELNNKLDGIALRVPVACGSIIDLTLELENKTDIESLNELFKSNQNDTLKFTLDPIVSSDILGIKCGALIDGLSTSVINSDDGQLVKILAWYDNETSYSNQMVKTAKVLLNKYDKLN